MPWPIRVLPLLALFAAAPAAAQGGAADPVLVEALRGAFAHQTPAERRAFCLRVGQAALRCGSTDAMVVSACLVRGLPPADSARVARVANAMRGNAGGVLHECGIALR